MVNVIAVPVACQLTTCILLVEQSIATVCAHVAGVYTAHTVSAHCTVVLPVITHPAFGRELVSTGPVHPVYPVGPIPHVGQVQPVGHVTVLAGHVHPVYPVGHVTVLAAPVGHVGQIFAIHTTHSSVPLLYNTSHLYCSHTT